MIDLASLTALRAVDDHGSVVAAAEALGFTPSAISQQVKRLERQTNVPLLERVGRGVMLTREGRHLVDAGSRLLADLETIESGLHQQAGTVAGHLRIIAFSTAMRGLVAPRVRALRDAHPDLVLSLTEREPWDTVDLVATGQADVGVVHSWGDVTLAIPDHLETTSLADDVADVIVPAGHRLAKRRRVTPHDLVDEGWIATPDGTICREWLSRMYLGTGRQPRIAHESLEFQSHLALVEAGLGIALVPRLGREELAAGLVAVRAHDPVPTRNIVAVHRRSMSESPAVRAVVAALSGQPST
jgi:DNA-binding transcriptional LysR family regulator